ncbi:WD40-repeat-containing domain protein [Pyronema domesticum]|uniref:Similar to Histone acetyltransferase type B subunit 2 acc. no. Q2UA71 n=1 Tax=Pyronema omphalodes (strain CBS 100304) TaxID=1076935 RepID=U4L8R5_PYROM|nr:WD40-repeat-containing domain protein [Pyronema domesticum]CCX09748.1 Similar to Histone acetyltransferase type B subunit 2; acc. no. Q2UA71 [Pyronema omphalodes CBS 100304]
MEEDMDMDPTFRDSEDRIVYDKMINEEYKTWKKNAPFLYDTMVSTALEWPTLTTQWFPDKIAHPDKNYSTHRLLIGTHTSGNDVNYLQIAEVQLPNAPGEQDPRKYDETKEEVGGYGGGNECRLSITQRIVHEGEVNKARHMPQKPDLIATMCADGNVLVFDKTKHPLEPVDAQKCIPEMRLKGHYKEGYGLAWNPHIEGHLLTGSEDTTVKLWDTRAWTQTNRTLSPTTSYTHHTAIVNDVAYHPLSSNLFGSVSDDRTLQIIDTRSGETTKPSLKVPAHSDAVNCIAFNPASDYIVATASADKTIGLWDLRNIKQKLHSFMGHTAEVNGLAWHPHEESVLASSSADRRIIFWDLARIGEEQTSEDAEDGPPELLFMHGGHTNRVSDFAWNPNDPWVMVSAAEDNLIQCWKVSNTIVGRDMADPDDADLE